MTVCQLLLIAFTLFTCLVSATENSVSN